MTHTNDGTGLIAHDPWLEPYRSALQARYAHFLHTKNHLAGGDLTEGGSLGHRYFGFNRGVHEGKPGVWYREWAPAAEGLFLFGDFNDWNRESNPLQRDEWGIWSTFLPDEQYAHSFVHGSLLKVHVRTSQGARDRIPAYIRRVIQDSGSPMYTGQYWNPPTEYAWRHAGPKTPNDSVTPLDPNLQEPSPACGGGQGGGPNLTTSLPHEPSPTGGGQGGGPIDTAKVHTRTQTSNQEVKPRSGLRIYEAHVGMAPEDGHVGSFAEFTANVLPRIADLGYNAVQLMAIMEHPYYGSFGYQVSNLFAVSSRFGTPEDLKALIDEAHGLGLKVIMDVIHSHAVKNLDEGLNRFDGTPYQYFHDGGRGEHPAWDSLLYNYATPEVLRYLLSNVRFWLEEFRFDGFRFDGVTSLVYVHHGLGHTFTSYHDYFSEGVDEDAVTYLMLANDLVHALRPDAVTIAEDVSGMPGMARPVAEGGVGFDYRLAMGVPDFWIKLLKERPDEGWSLGEIYYELLNRRRSEKHIGYAESHDQAMVGDKTIAFWLMDAKMYTDMSKFAHDPIIERGIALHKMIRLITFSLAGEGYLNFMGNEFGHPEWIDFPRPENGFSGHYARRQWSLLEVDHLHYHELRDFDRAMMGLDDRFGLLEDALIEQLALHEDSRQLVYRRGPLVFVFNLHVTESYQGLRIPVPDAADYRVVLNTDSAAFGGFGLVTEGQVYPWQSVPMYSRQQSIQIYLPARSAQVLAPAMLT